MPEGDAVRRLAGTLDELFVGGIVSASSPQGRFASSAALLDGWVMQRVRVHGKHMFIGFVPPIEGETYEAGVALLEGAAAGLPRRKCPPVSAVNEAVNNSIGCPSAVALTVFFMMYPFKTGVFAVSKQANGSGI